MKDKSEKVKYIIVTAWRREITGADIEKFAANPNTKRYDTYKEAKKIMDKRFFDDSDYGIFEINE